VDAIFGWRRPALAVKAAGRGSDQRSRLDKYGFPRGYLMRDQAVSGFQTGDMVRDGHVKRMHSALGYVSHEYFEAQLARQGA
jgi:hypothetical protein